MTEVIKQAQAMHRKAIEGTYDGVCRIYELRPVKDPVTRVTRKEEVVTADHVSCHLSFSGAVPVSEAGMAAVVSQSIKLFLAPELEVRPGSRIDVIQQGRRESYCRSGKAAVYSSHQEILLDLWKGYA